MEKKNEILKKLIPEIENSCFKTIQRSPLNRTFKFSPHSYLTKDLSGWVGALTVRAMLFEFKIDEHRIFKWRPENKYIQYLILNHYSRGCMPNTLSLTSVLKNAEWVNNIREFIKSGYFIKSTLGFGSARTNSFDRTLDFEQILNQIKKEPGTNEEWIIQKKLKLNKEFRVHTFGKDILYGMTFRISGSRDADDFNQPQEFVNLILQKLPDSLLEGTLIGWDVGLTKRGKYYVIEANFTGFHPEYHAGFQTTGYVEDPSFGPIICAWLNNYFKAKYAVSIDSVQSILLTRFPFLEEFIYYLSIFKNEHIEILIKTKGTVRAAYIYLNEKINPLIVRLIDYFRMAHFAKKYYIISNQTIETYANQMFREDDIIHLAEHSLLKKDHYEEVQQLDHESRKQFLCNQAIELTKEKSYIII